MTARTDAERALSEERHASEERPLSPSKGPADERPLSLPKGPEEVGLSAPGEERQPLWGPSTSSGGVPGSGGVGGRSGGSTGSAGVPDESSPTGHAPRTERQAINYCPYCSEEDLFPLEGGGWECRSCRRAFSVSFKGLVAPGRGGTP